MARKRHRKPGDLGQLRAILWQAILAVEALLDVRPCATDVVLKSAHALAQLCGAYRGIVQDVEIEQRLAALERAAAERDGHESR